MLRKAGCFAIAANLALCGANLRAEPPSTKTSNSTAALARLLESANGWTYVNGQWVHPEGYKFLNNKIIRTTAKTGKAHPKPPGKLAQENAAKLAQENSAKLAPRTKSAAAPSSEDARIAAEKAAEVRRKNLTPRPAPQTGSHL
jgi:hypothetical protein